MSTLRDLINEKNQYLEERAKVYDLVQDIYVGLCSDNERGVHWMNNEQADKWVKENPRTHAAIRALSEYIQDWHGEEDDE